MTLWQITDDVAVALGMTVDDARLNRVALAYYVKMAVDKVRDQIIGKSYTTGIVQASDMLETFVVDVTQNDPDAAGIPWRCMYFDLPHDLYSLPYDGGLAWVRYHRPTLPANCPPALAGTVFTHTTLGALSNLYELKYQSPEPLRPYTARDRYRVYVFGVNSMITKLHVGLFCTLPDFTEIDPNEQVSIPAEYLLAVRKMVIDAARFSLQLPERLQNDGRDLEQPIRTERQLYQSDPLNTEQV